MAVVVEEKRQKVKSLQTLNFEGEVVTIEEGFDTVANTDEYDLDDIFVAAIVVVVVVVVCIRRVANDRIT